MPSAVAEPVAPGAGSEPLLLSNWYLSHQVGLFWLSVDWARALEAPATVATAKDKSRWMVFIE